MAARGMAGRELTPKGWRYWPDEGGAVGLVLCEDDQGDRHTLVVEGDWLRMLEQADRVLDTALQVPEEARFPVEATGWPEDWGGAQTAGLLDTVAADLDSGVSWQDIVRAVEQAFNRPR